VQHSWIPSSFADGRVQPEDLLTKNIFPLSLPLSFFVDLQESRDETVLIGAVTG